MIVRTQPGFIGEKHHADDSTNDLPNWRSIRLPINDRVQRPTSNLNCCGECSRMFFASHASSSSVTLDGLPGIALASKAFYPPLAKSASQRYTVLTFRPNAAASCGAGSPSRTAFTACWRIVCKA